MRIGERIRDVRHRKGLSQEELAEKADINRTYLSQLEHNKSSPTLDVVERIAAALGVTSVELMGGASGDGESRPAVEYSSDSIHPGLQEFLDDERTRLLMNPTAAEIEILKSIRFIDSFRPSKQFFIEALFEYRRSHEQ